MQQDLHTFQSLLRECHGGKDHASKYQLELWEEVVLMVHSAMFSSRLHGLSRLRGTRCRESTILPLAARLHEAIQCSAESRTSAVTKVGV